MSVSVDDLVASLNGQHIGKDAIELAALQAQLTQSLYQYSQFHLPSSPVAGYGFEFAAPNSTPVRTTKPRSNSLIPAAANATNDDIDMMDDEEVEQQLIASPQALTLRLGPPQRGRKTSHSQSSRSHPSFHHLHHAQSPTATSATAPDTTTSCFTATDPFYAVVSAQQPFMRPTTVDSGSVWDNHPAVRQQAQTQTHASAAPPNRHPM